MKAKNIMTKKVITVQKNALVSEAANKMKQAGVGAVAVEDNGNIVGLITDRDIVLRDVAEADQPGQMRCSDIMSTNIATATPESNVDDVARVMSERQVKRIPIVEQSKIVGMVSLADLSQTRGKKSEAGDTLRDITTKQTFQ
ncbi:CBS domain protein [Alkalibaculum bacchi]|uniref:CBS domain protein n=1 Tax=Alkalibaculum bacchi TaxID=645887 RepID=A0A366I825_9FIRM|nr:CBS domain-containing protein [Alkalibaculum bacchi]RBP64461.1 CBS domain protein [Alkalibaculum bacchi]